MGDVKGICYFDSERNHFYGTVVITMTIVGMMKMPIDKVINMIAVWNGFMPTFGAMNMVRIMAVASVTLSTLIGIGGVS